MKKIICLVLALIMMLAMGIEAFAATIGFSHAYDCQREPAFPKELKPSTLKGFKASSYAGNVIEGNWILSEVCKYGEFTAPAGVEVNTAFLESIAEYIAEEYGIDNEDDVMVYELKNGDTHVTYGVVAAYDGEKGILLFVGAQHNEKGAGYLLSPKAITEDSIVMDATTDAGDLGKGYGVNVVIDNTKGSASVNKFDASQNDEISVTVNPAEGYELESITVKGENGEEIAVSEGKFTMPASDVTVTVTFKETYTPAPNNPVPVPESEPDRIVVDMNGNDAAEETEEANPNTGAPVLAPAVIVLAALALIRRK